MSAILAYLCNFGAKVLKKRQLCKKNSVFILMDYIFIVTLSNNTHLKRLFSPIVPPFICPLSPLEAHWNLIGTSPYLYRKMPLISSTFHLPFSYKKTHLFQSAFLYSYNADTYNPFSSLSFSSSNSEISSAWRMYSSHSLGSQFLTIIF